MPLLILLLVFAGAFVEFKLLALVYRAIAGSYDALSAIFLILLSFAFAFYLGSRLIRHQSRKMMQGMQSGEVVGKDATRGFLTFLAGVLFILPGYASDLLALLCLFPPTAWIINQILGRLLRNLMKKANFVTFGNLGGFGGGRQTTGFESPFSNIPRADGPSESTVIDVEVVETTKKLH